MLKPKVLQAAITRICEESAQAVRDGKTLIVLTDKNIRQGYLPANRCACNRCTPSPHKNWFAY